MLGRKVKSQWHSQTFTDPPHRIKEEENKKKVERSKMLPLSHSQLLQLQFFVSEFLPLASCNNRQQIKHLTLHLHHFLGHHPICLQTCNIIRCTAYTRKTRHESCSLSSTVVAAKFSPAISCGMKQLLVAKTTLDTRPLSLLLNLLYSMDGKPPPTN